MTNDEFRRLVPGHKGDDGLPAVNVNWFEAYVYAAWLGGRLPTEAEWEYAARAGCPSDYCVEVDGKIREVLLDDVGWYLENSDRQLHHVCRKLPNPWGLYDMYGNASEWVGDWWALYTAVPIQDPWGPLSTGNRVIRGGGIWEDAGWVRAAFRTRGDPMVEYAHLGFRVVRPAAPSQ